MECESTDPAYTAYERGTFFYLKNRPGRPVQVAHRVFNRGQSLRDGQFVFVSIDLIFESIGFYHSSGAIHVQALVAVDR